MNTKRRENCQLRNDWKERIIRIGDEQTSLQNQFDNFRNEYGGYPPLIEGLETTVNGFDGRLIIAESDIADAENRISECENDIDSLEAEVDALDGRVSITESDISAAENRITACENDIDSLESEVNSLEGRVNTAESDIADAEDRISACENDIDRIDAELVDKTGEINNLSNRLTIAEGDIDYIDARLDGIETGNILLSQLVPDADKDMEGKSLRNLGLISLQGSITHQNANNQGRWQWLLTGDETGGDSGSDLILRSRTDAGQVKVNVLRISRASGNLGVRNSFIPIVDDVAHIGQPSLRFKHGYYSGVISASGVAIIDGGTVDGVDISTHTHDGTAIGGPKISYNDLVDKPTILTAGPAFKGYKNSNLSGVTTEYLLLSSGRSGFIPMKLYAKRTEGPARITIYAILDDSSEVPLIATDDTVTERSMNAQDIADKLGDYNKSGRTITALKIQQTETGGKGKVKIDAYEF
jgi:outer membrane murein-binding lipoprotein Lpp